MKRDEPFYCDCTDLPRYLVTGKVTKVYKTLNRTKIRDLLYLAFPSSAVERMLKDGKIRNVKVKAECDFYESRKGTLSKWLVDFAAVAQATQNAAPKNKDKKVVKEIIENYLVKVVRGVFMYKLREALKRELIAYAEANGLDLEADGKQLLERALASVSMDEVYAESATVLNVLIWLALNPARAVLLAAYVEDEKGEVFAFDPIAEEMLEYIVKIVGACVSGVNLNIYGKGKRPLIKEPTVDVYDYPPKPYKYMLFPCAVTDKKDETELAKRLMLGESADCCPQERTVVPLGYSSFIKFVRPPCGRMKPYVVTKDGSKVIGYKPFELKAEASAEARVSSAVSASALDFSHLRPNQRKTVEEMLVKVLAYGGAVLNARTGWGKTVSALKFVENAKRLLDVSKVLFVTKAALAEQVRAEAKRFGVDLDVLSYETAYSAISAVDDDIDFKRLEEEFRSYLEERYQHLAAHYKKAKSLYEFLRSEGAYYVYYEFLVSYILSLKPRYKWLYSLRVISDEWLKALALGKLYEAEKRSRTPKEEVLKLLEDAELVIFDEVHLIRQISKLRVVEAVAKAYKVGLSATPQHLYSPWSAQLLLAHFGPVIVGLEDEKIDVGKAEEEVGKGVVFTKVNAFINTRDVSKYWREVLDALRKLDLKDKKVLVLTKYIKGVEDFVKQAKEVLGVTPLPITEDVKVRGGFWELGDIKEPAPCGASDAKELAKCMDKGMYVATVSKLGTGWNDPKLDVVVIAYPLLKRSSNVGNLIQIVGRSLRFAKGKEKKTVVLVCPMDDKYLTCDVDFAKEIIEKELRKYSRD